MDSARHVIGCHINQETRKDHAFDDVASTALLCSPQERMAFDSRNTGENVSDDVASTTNQSLHRGVGGGCLRRCGPGGGGNLSRR